MNDFTSEATLLRGIFDHLIIRNLELNCNTLKKYTRRMGFVHSIMSSRRSTTLERRRVDTVELSTVLFVIKHKLKVLHSNNPNEVVLYNELLDLLTEERVKRLRGRFVTLFLLLTYAVLTSVSITIASAFACINVDPQGVTGLGKANTFLV